MTQVVDVDGPVRSAFVLPGPGRSAGPAVWRAVLVALMVVALGDVAAVLVVEPPSALAGEGAQGVGGRTEVAGPAPVVGAASPAPAAPAVPVGLAIPSLALQTDLLGLTLAPDRTLAAPEDATKAGWWSQGTVPGEPGPAVIVGHVDSRSGPAVFFRIHELRPGDTVQIRRADGKVVTFEVDDVQQYRKEELPTALVYGPTPTPTLRLITCGGRFDRREGSYEDNVVVFAHQSGPAPTGGRA